MLARLDRLMNIDYCMRCVFSYTFDIIAVYVHAHCYFKNLDKGFCLNHPVYDLGGCKFETLIIWTVVCMGEDKNLS